MKKILISTAVLILAALSLRAQLIFSDSLDYPSGNITNTSGGVWVAHSGSGSDSLEVNHRYEVNEGRATDIHRWFNPVNTNGYLSGVLYASFFMKMTNFPSATGTYFAHFMDTGNSFRGRIFALTNNAYPGTYRLAVANAAGDGSPNKVLPLDLALNIDYQAVLKYDIDNALAELWVNPVSETDPSSGGTGDIGSVTNALAAFAFRQAAGEGVSEIASLIVGQSFASVTTNAPAIPVIGLQPVPYTNYVGNPLSLLVLASGKGLGYQWVQNGSAVPGATLNQYSVSQVQASHQGDYYCIVSNTAGSTNSTTVFVSVNATPTPPFFTLLPQNTTNALGQTARFNAAASGTGPLTYQWNLNNNPLADGPSGAGSTIAGALTPSLTISSLTVNDAGNYTLTVQGANGTTNSPNALLVVQPPVIFISSGNYSQNFDTLAASGNNTWNDGGTLPGWYASTNVGPVTIYRAETGTGTAGALYSFGTNGVNPSSDRALGSVSSGTPVNVAYGVLFTNDTSKIATNLTIAYTGEQWRNGGNASPQTLAFSYRISSTQITGSDSSDTATWTPVTALNFTTPTVGATATALDGNAPANRVVISGVLLTNVTLLPGQEIMFRWKDINDTGNDHALAVDDLSITFTTFSPPATPPAFTTQPQARTNNAGSTAIFTAGVSGGTPLTFQWLKNSAPLSDGPTGNGSTISGSTGPALTISSVFAGDAGDYQLNVTNSLGSTNSSVAHLTVMDPVISTQPVNVTNVIGDNGNFFVQAIGTPTLTYQWLSNGVAIPGANAASLNFPVTQASSQAGYSVIVINGLSGSATSSVANIILVATPANKIAQWDFNSPTPDANTATGTTLPAVGAGTAALLGGTTATFGGGSFTDPAVTGTDNSAWVTAGYPSPGTANKMAGVQFNLSTVSYKDIMVTWEQRHSATASKYTRLQYSTDGINFTDFTTANTMVNTNLDFQFFKNDLSGIPSVSNNPNFAFRIVTEFQSTATGGGLTDYVPTLPGNYGTGGTIRFDWLNVFANSTNAVTPTPLSFQQIGSQLVLTWGSGFSLQAAPEVTGVYTNIPSATSPYTNTTTGPRMFFRLKSN